MGITESNRENGLQSQPMCPSGEGGVRDGGYGVWGMGGGKGHPENTTTCRSTLVAKWTQGGPV